VLFMTDNGHSVPNLFNAGMRGMKGGPYQGGTRVPSFWRWPGTLAPGDRPQLAAHLDVFPTLARLAGATLPTEVAAQVEGRNLVRCSAMRPHRGPTASGDARRMLPRGRAAVEGSILIRTAWHRR
jgi:arylsulfatase A-like enzyme